MRHTALLALMLALTAAAVPSRAPAASTETNAPEGGAALDPARQRTLYLGIIESLRKDGRASAALAHLDSFDRQYPKDARAEILRGDCLADIGQAAEAEAIYRKAVTGPFADQAQAGLGHIYAGRGNWAEAVAAFADAVKRQPTRASYLNDLGFALVKAGRGEEGQFRLRQALELAPDDVLVRNNLIVALKAAGKTADAGALVDAVKSPVERTAARAVFAAAVTTSPAAKGDAR